MRRGAAVTDSNPSAFQRCERGDYCDGQRGAAAAAPSSRAANASSAHPHAEGQ